jgi:hypothetical protein
LIHLTVIYFNIDDEIIAAVEGRNDDIKRAKVRDPFVEKDDN